MTLPTSLLSSAPGMISLNESGAAFSSVLPVSIDICCEVIDEVPDMPDELVDAICEAIEVAGTDRHAVRIDQRAIGVVVEHGEFHVIRVLDTGGTHILVNLALGIIQVFLEAGQVVFGNRTGQAGCR